MLSLLVSVLLVRQNPLPPYVLLPRDWKLSYGARGGKNLGLIEGPHGEEIRFPAYGGGTSSAAAVHRRDKEALYIDAFLRGRPVQVALSQKGTLTVSLGKRLPLQRASDSSIDFTCEVENARQAVNLLRITLTRLESQDALAAPFPYRAEDIRPTQRVIPGDPFPFSPVLPIGYRYRAGLPNDPNGGLFESEKWPVIEFHDEDRIGKRSFFNKPVYGKDWIEFIQLFGQDFRFWTVEGKSLYTKELGLPGRHAQLNIDRFRAQECTPRAAVILVLAQLGRHGNRSLYGGF